MKIGDYEYKGYKYEIHFANRGDWGKHLNHFHTQCEHNFDGGYRLSLDTVKTHIESQIDLFLANQPKTIDELVSEIACQLVWTGYEDAHLDEKTTKALIETFIKTHS